MTKSKEDIIADLKKKQSEASQKNGQNATGTPPVAIDGDSAKVDGNQQPLGPISTAPGDTVGLDAASANAAESKNATEGHAEEQARALKEAALQEQRAKQDNEAKLAMQKREQEEAAGPYGDVVAKRKGAVDAFRAVYNGLNPTTPDSHVLFGVAGTAITVGHIRAMFD